MVIDKLENLEKYYALNPLFKEVAAFLAENDMNALPTGIHKIKGDDLFVNIQEAKGKTRDEAVIEYAMVRILNVCSFEILICTYEITAGALRGMNRSMVPTVLVLLGSCAFRLVWVATVFAHRRTFAVLMQVYPMSWIITGIAVVSAYFIISRKVFRRLREIRENAQKKEN